jgi:GDP-L-fucose synthase
MLDLRKERIVVTGGAGFLGRVVCQQLRERGVPEEQILVPRRRDYDLTERSAVDRMYREMRPTVVLHLAAVVGGIGANRRHPGAFFYANMAMGLHLIEAARQFSLRKFVQVGTVCAYPKFAPVPFREDDLWNGFPEETNAPYGVAKKALFVMLDGYQREYGLASSVVVPVNLYGPGDNFDPDSSHVIPALIRKCEEARLRGDEPIVVWGTGRASREFLYVEDCAAGILAAAERMETPLPINLGTGSEITIQELVALIARLCDYQGGIKWDVSQPDGQPRRQLDVSRAEALLGWRARVGLEEGLRRTIDWWRRQRTLGTR